MSKVVLARDYYSKIDFGIYHRCKELQTNKPVWFVGGKVGENGKIITHWTELNQPKE